MNILAAIYHHGLSSTKLLEWLVARSVLFSDDNMATEYKTGVRKVFQPKNSGEEFLGNEYSGFGILI